MSEDQPARRRFSGITATPKRRVRPTDSHPAAVRGG
jgi:hypothetical protein